MYGDKQKVFVEALLVLPVQAAGICHADCEEEVPSHVLFRQDTGDCVFTLHTCGVAVSTAPQLGHLVPLTSSGGT